MSIMFHLRASLESLQKRSLLMAAPNLMNLLLWINVNYLSNLDQKVVTGQRMRYTELSKWHTQNLIQTNILAFIGQAHRYQSNSWVADIGYIVPWT